MTSTLTINEITEGDYDTYYVRAQNSNGYVRDASYTPSKQVQLVSGTSWYYNGIFCYHKLVMKAPKERNYIVQFIN